MKKLFFLAIIMIAIVAIPLSGRIKKITTSTKLVEVLSLSGKGNFQQEYNFSDSSLVFKTSYIGTDTTKAFIVKLGSQTIVNKEMSCVDSLNVEIVEFFKNKGNFTLKVRTESKKDPWSIKIFEKRTTTKIVGVNTGTGIKKKREKGVIIDTTFVDNKTLITYKRKVNYVYKIIRVDPFLFNSLGHELSLTSWPKDVQDSLVAQFVLAAKTNEQEGVKTVYIKNGETLDWMFSGGVNSSQRTLDEGVIKVGITSYKDQNGLLKPTKGIRAKCYETVKDDKIYRLYWFLTRIGGVDQCGNLAGKVIQIKTTK